MKLWKTSVLGYVGGMCYVALELMWRGWSHGSMFLVGGVCFLLVGGLDRVFPGIPVFLQSVLGACLITAVELVSGLVLNVVLRLHVWDYSALPYNFMGQVCMAYFFLWVLVSFLAVWLSDLMRWGLFGETIIHKRLSLSHEA